MVLQDLKNIIPLPYGMMLAINWYVASYAGKDWSISMYDTDKQ
jgi:hypothetical protein